MPTYTLNTDNRNPQRVTAETDHAAIDAAWAYYQYTLADTIEICKDDEVVARLTVEMFEDGA